jgi:hypothetical protein
MPFSTESNMPLMITGAIVLCITKKEKLWKVNTTSPLTGRQTSLSKRVRITANERDNRHPGSHKEYTPPLEMLLFLTVLFVYSFFTLLPHEARWGDILLHEL